MVRVKAGIAVVQSKSKVLVSNVTMIYFTLFFQDLTQAQMRLDGFSGSFQDGVLVVLSLRSPLWSHLWVMTSLLVNFRFRNLQAKEVNCRPSSPKDTEAVIEVVSVSPVIASRISN